MDAPFMRFTETEFIYANMEALGESDKVLLIINWPRLPKIGPDIFFSRVQRLF